MGKLKAAAFSVSIDGYGAGPDQDIDNPFGVGGMQLPAWMLKTNYFHKMTGRQGGSTDISDQIAKASMENLDAWIMGRTPAKRWGKPDELVGAAVFLSSQASDYVNGQLIYVDGGILAVL